MHSGFPDSFVLEVLLPLLVFQILLLIGSGPALQEELRSEKVTWTELSETIKVGPSISTRFMLHRSCQRL